MDWDRFAGDWSGMTDKVRQQWGKLTEEDISQAGGKRDLLMERIRERYGIGPDEAKRQLEEWGASQDGGNSGQSISTDRSTGNAGARDAGAGDQGAGDRSPRDVSAGGTGPSDMNPGDTGAGGAGAGAGGAAKGQNGGV
ncbi:hypothetical protein EAH89_23420 [Roseomonas nepalensis]|uniref:CsbD family protein n=1 Tax=Muricoccus nepalensis TaxID=1854500 RepID=A0A502FD63_9PROT|nr:hypothetical protein [Roseomonas nepalensis]TPG47261.1 hypothetical protein EAH89_23420 [Roseomonas nepalensis]